MHVWCAVLPVYNMGFAGAYMTVTTTKLFLRSRKRTNKLKGKVHDSDLWVGSNFSSFGKWIASCMVLVEIRV